MDYIGSWMLHLVEMMEEKWWIQHKDFSTLTKMALTILKNYQDEDKEDFCQ